MQAMATNVTTESQLAWEDELDEATWGDLKDELRAMDAAYGSEAMLVRRSGAKAGRADVDTRGGEAIPCAVEVRVPLKPLTGEDETHQVGGRCNAIWTGRCALHCNASMDHVID